jgi:hypothetical protein
MGSLHFHNVMIILFEPLASANSIDDTGPKMGPSPRDIVNASKLCMETLIRIHYLRNSYEQGDGMGNMFLHFVAFNTLRDLAAAEPAQRDSLLSTVVLCAKALRDQGRSYYFAEVIFAVLRDSMEPETGRLLRDFARIENEEERKLLMARQVQSLYPVGVAGLADDADERRIGSLVQGVAEVGVVDETDSESEDSS